MKAAADLYRSAFSGVRIMYCAFMTLPRQQSLLLTLWRVSDEELLVNIVPKPVTNDRIAENNAPLTTALTVRGTPQELDEHLSRQLLEFVEAHLALSSTLKTAKEEMEAAAKAAREAARKPTKANSHSGSSGSAASRSAQVQTK